MSNKAKRMEYRRVLWSNHIRPADHLFHCEITVMRFAINEFVYLKKSNIDLLLLIYACSNISHMILDCESTLSIDHLSFVALWASLFIKLGNWQINFSSDSDNGALYINTKTYLSHH